MRSLLSFLLLLFFFVHNTNAQEAKQNYKVLFASDHFELDEGDQRELNKLIDAAKIAKYYEIELTAHTDFDGSRTYNQQLSANRANSVRQYLVEKGLASGQIHDAWYGENRPVATNYNEHGKQQNRRVEITLSTYSFSNVNELLDATKGEYEQKFVLESNDEQVIQGRKGTKVSIPADAFALPDGSPVDNKGVEVALEEFQTMSDALFNNLSTLSDGRILESGGMMKITASYKGQELELRSGKAVDVELPSNNIKQGMTVFTGVKNADGIVEWEDTKQSFDVTPKDKKARPSLQLDVELLKKYFHEIPEAHAYTNHSIDIELPKAPALPAEPKEPTQPKRPNPDNVVHGLKKVLTPRSARERIAEKKYAAMMLSYQERYDRYIRSKGQYAEAVKQYERDILEYEDAKKAFYAQADALIAQLSDQIDHYKEIYDVKRWNGALSSMIAAVEREEFYQRAPLRWLNNASSMYLHDDISTILHQLDRRRGFLKQVKNMDIEAIAKDFSSKGKLSYAKYESRVSGHIGYNRLYMVGLISNTNPIAAEMTGDANLQDMLTSAGMALAEREAELGIMDANSLNSLYTASLPQLGYVNCDVFYSVPPALMTKIKIANPGTARVTICIKRINSIITPSMTRDRSLMTSLPEGEEVIIIALKVDEETGKPLFEKQVVKIDASVKSYNVNPKPVQVKELVSALATI